MKDILVVAIVFAVPISAILSAAKVKLRRMELEAGAGGARHLEERCAKIERENADLQQRLSVLESIVTMDAPVRAPAFASRRRRSRRTTGPTWPPRARRRASAGRDRRPTRA